MLPVDLTVEPKPDALSFWSATVKRVSGFVEVPLTLPSGPEGIPPPSGAACLGESDWMGAALRQTVPPWTGPGARGRS